MSNGDSGSKAVAFVLVSLGLVCYIVMYVVWGGYVLSLLWAWLITPTFSGAPVVGVAQACGIVLVTRVLTRGLSPKREKGASLESSLREYFFDPLISGVLALATGVVLKRFM